MLNPIVIEYSVLSVFQGDSRRVGGKVEVREGWSWTVVVDKRFDCSRYLTFMPHTVPHDTVGPVCNSSIIYRSGRSDCMSGKRPHMSVIGGIQSTLTLSVLVLPFYNDCDASEFSL